ncbi:hypothetical protein [Streptomyces sp. NPDC057939]|uniref:hypothetical protein n=1 Tax=Streptomyces sp. NPDC057939 TaxID=3346284 RepID=UPI0036E9D43C
MRRSRTPRTSPMARMARASRTSPGRAYPYRRAGVPAAVAVLLVTLCAGTAAPARQDFDPATVARLDAAITKVMKEAGIPGLNVGVWVPGRGTYEKSFGVGDKKTGAPM